MTREDKYKAKNFIDTVVYRLGDQVGAWFGTGAGMLAVPVAVVWVVNALWLGRRQDVLAAAPESMPTCAASEPVPG